MKEKEENWLLKNPRKLFLIDGIGALVSAVLLGVVLVKLERFFGIPTPTLYLLALLPCLFFMYDAYGYFRVKHGLGKYLKGIAFLNLGYSLLSLALTFSHRHVITTLGWSYILGEISIILILVIVEFRIANKQAT